MVELKEGLAPSPVSETAARITYSASSRATFAWAA